MSAILLTGSSRGIGAAAREALEKRGAKVIGHATSARDAKTIAANFTEPSAPQMLWEEALDRAGGQIDVLVNNAGGDPGAGIQTAAHGPFEDPEQFQRMVDLNFTSAHTVTSVIGPELVEGAAICSTASIAGQMASPLFAYGAAKCAVIHWTKSMARVLGQIEKVTC